VWQEFDTLYGTKGLKLFPKLLLCDIGTNVPDPEIFTLRTLVNLWRSFGNSAPADAQLLTSNVFAETAVIRLNGGVDVNEI